MTIIFDSEGGFREISDPPKPKVKHFSYHIYGTSLTQLFNALKFYPTRKVRFEVNANSIHGLEFISTAFCEMVISGIRVLLVPMRPEDAMTIDNIKDHWTGEGFIETRNGFKEVSFSYNSKKREGTLYFSMVEEKKN